ncbi:hypothetical protein TA3x_001631 [Tundrisphaera sp. TA3]|uniref:hypothetical protein n=1 Tax=Tundrisphaera sp. TA3 TaxID=3435775 RepID=UPI003EBACFAC
MKPIAIAARRAGAAWLLPMLLLAPAARGQDLDDPEPAPAAAGAGMNNGFILSENNFYMWVYGSNQLVDGTGPDRYAARLASLLQISLDDIDRSCHLTEAQKAKLALAGRGDIKHFQDRVLVAKRFFDQFKADQNKIGEIHQETVPLAALIQNGLFGDGSFFAKAIRTTLDPAQVEQYRADLRLREAFRYRAKVEASLLAVDATVRFTEEQYRRLVDLLIETTAPPRKWAGSQNDRQIVLIKLGRIPNDKVRPLFDDARWAELNRQIAQANQMERFLKAQGFLDEEPPAGPSSGEGAR